MITPEDPTYAAMFALESNLDTLGRVMYQSKGYPTMSTEDVKLSVVSLFMAVKHIQEIQENIIERIRAIESEVGL